MTSNGAIDARERVPGGRTTLYPSFVLGGVCAFAFLLLRQEWLYGDGYDQVRVLARAIDLGDLPVWRHVLYLPLARVLAAPPLELTPRAACAAISALSGGVLVAYCHALARNVAGPRTAAIVAILAATSPAVWFFATTVEVHALQGAVAAVGAAATLGSRGSRRMLVAGASVAACFLAHESSWLLIPGWALLAAGFADPALARGTIDRRELARAAGAVLAGALIGVAVAAGVKRLGIGAGAMSALELVDLLRGSPNVEHVWSGVVAPHVGLLALACLGLWDRRELALFVAFTLPHAAFVVSIFEDPNLGGYLMPLVWLFARTAARGLAVRPGLLWLALPLVAFHLHASWEIGTAPGQDRAREQRTARAAAATAVLLDGGLVVSADFSLQTIEGEKAGVYEVNLWREIAGSIDADEAPSSFARRMLDLLPALAARHPALAFDLSYENDLAPFPAARSRMDALIRAIRESTHTRIVQHGDVRMLVLEP